MIRRNIRYGEKGAALLSVLLLVAVISILALSALERLKLTTHIAANGAAMDQAQAYGLAAETIAITRLTDLVLQNPDKTTLSGGWNGRQYSVPVPDGTARITARDGGNCFNLNSVVQGDAQKSLQQNPLAIAQFSALMENIGIGSDHARILSASLGDWIDSNSDISPYGAEDAYYRGLSTPYLPANGPMYDISELRAVAGMTPALYERLRPWICVLPDHDLTPININTLSVDQAPLFAMLLPGKLPVNMARKMLADRPEAGYDSLVNFWKLPALNALNPGQAVMNQTRLNTRWFALDIEIELGAAQLQERALVDAGLRPAKLVRRQWGEPS